MTKLTIAVILVALTATMEAGEQTTLYDSQGHVLVRSVTGSDGSSKYYDGQGRITGSSSTDSDGSTTYYYYDAEGRVTGSSGLMPKR